VWPKDFDAPTFRLFKSFFMSAETTTPEPKGADKDLALLSSVFSFEVVKFDSPAGALLILVGG